MLYRAIKRLIILATVVVATKAMATDENFNILFSIKSPISITVLQELLFPDVSIGGSDVNVVVSTTSPSAASFISQGGKNRTITRSVVPPTIYLSAPGVAGDIKVDSFVVSGPSSFDSTGSASFKVGATANILASNDDANYAGFTTFRVVYQ